MPPTIRVLKPRSIDLHLSNITYTFKSLYTYFSLSLPLSLSLFLLSLYWLLFRFHSNQFSMKKNILVPWKLESTTLLRVWQNKEVEFHRNFKDSFKIIIMKKKDISELEKCNERGSRRANHRISLRKKQIKVSFKI